MRTLPFASWYLGLALVARPCDRDAERTEYAQRKAGRGVRLSTRYQTTVLARTVRTPVGVEALPVTSYQMARFL